MKKLSLILSALLVTVLFMNGCSETAKHTENPPSQQVKEEYVCPMKCTEEKFEKPGKCPVCGMELEKVANG
jgi:PBP1b-binding outer membrane lipoprotein LpoB